MTDAIGPGTWLQRKDDGTVAMVLALLPPAPEGYNQTCSDCNEVPPFRMEMTHFHSLAGHCPNHWRPFLGPEQAKRQEAVSPPLLEPLPA